MGEMEQTDKCVLDAPIGEDIQQAFEELHKNEVNLYQKLLKAKDLIGIVKKEGKVSFKNTNYNYQRAEDIEIAVREALQKLGLLIIPTEFKVVNDSHNIITTTQTFRVLDADSGEYIDCDMGGQGQDSGDKRIYKAETGAYKYFMKQLFQIPSEGTDPDIIPSEAFTAPKTTDTGTLNWKDYVPKNGKHAGERLEDIAKNDLNWIKFWANKQSEAQPYCQSCLAELGV